MSPARATLALAKVAVTVALLWLVLTAAGLEAIGAALARVDIGVLALALGVLVLQFFAMVLRWQMLLELLFGKRAPLRLLAVTVGQGMLVGQVLPTTVGGDAYRMALVASHVGARAAVRSVICDRVLALAILVALVLLLSPLLAWRLGPTPAVLSVAAASALGLAAFAAAIFLGGWVSALPVVGESIASVIDDSRRALLSGAGAAIAAFLGLAGHLLGVLLVYLLALGLEAPVSALDCLLVVPPALLVSALPLSLGGWGLREGAFYAGFSMLGADPAAGVTVSVLFGASGILLGAICGLAGPFVAGKA